MRGGGGGVGAAGKAVACESDTARSRERSAASVLGRLIAALIGLVADRVGGGGGTSRVCTSADCAMTGRGGITGRGFALGTAKSAGGVLPRGSLVSSPNGLPLPAAACVSTLTCTPALRLRSSVGDDDGDETTVGGAEAAPKRLARLLTAGLTAGESGASSAVDGFELSCCGTSTPFLAAAFRDSGTGGGVLNDDARVGRVAAGGIGRASLEVSSS